MSDCFKLCADARPIAAAAAILAKVAETKRRVETLDLVQLTAADGALTMTCTDLSQWARVSIACAVEIEGAAYVNASAFAEALKGIAKDKGARVDMAPDDSGARLCLMSGRTRLFLALDLCAADKVAPFPTWEAGETRETSAEEIAAHGIEGRDFDKREAATLKKLAKACKGMAATIETLAGDTDADAIRWRATVGAWTFATALHVPGYSWKPQRRERFTFRNDAALVRDARAYLDALRETHGLPLIRSPKEYGGEYPAELVTRDGRPLGLTVGACWNDYPERRDMPEGWTPPEGSTFDDDGFGATAPDGRYYTDNARMGPAFAPGAWRYHYKPEGREGALIYSDGAYSLPMPADRRTALTALTVEVDGESIPLAADWAGDISREIALTAEEIAALCGPVDPSTFVEIEPLAFHHGRVIARGDDARRFERMREAFDKNARKAIRNCRTSADTNLTATNLGMAWRDRVAEFLASEAPAAPIEEAPAVEAIPAPVEIEPTPAAVEIEEAPAVEPEEIEEEAPCYGGRHTDTGRGVCADCGAILAREEARADPVPVPESAPDYAEAMPAPAAALAPIAAPAAADDMARRLERLEQALGLVEAPKRTPAHAAAIRRAWRNRAEARRMREGARIERQRAELSEAAAQCERDRANALQGQLNADARRVEAIEGARNDERAELVAEIDRLRAELERVREIADADAVRHADMRHAHRRTVKRAAIVRRDLARSRAHADGLAGNVQALTARIAADAATLASMPADRPRFILSAR